MAKKKVYLLMYDAGDGPEPLVAFRKQPSWKKLAEYEVGPGLESVEEIKQSFEEGSLSWEVVLIL